MSKPNVTLPEMNATTSFPLSDLEKYNKADYFKKFNMLSPVKFISTQH